MERRKLKVGYTKTFCCVIVVIVISSCGKVAKPGIKLFKSSKIIRSEKSYTLNNCMKSNFISTNIQKVYSEKKDSKKQHELRKPNP
jgi:hypothetical protein